jgi:TonB family protein
MDQAEMYAIAPVVEMINISGKQITRLVVSFYKGGKVVQERHFVANIAPGQTYTYKDEIRDQLTSILASGQPLMTVPGSIEGLVVKIRGGNFEDESSWGEPTPRMKLNPKSSAKVTVNGGVLDSRASEKPLPVYPVEAKSLGIAGVVVVAVTVDVDGKVALAEATAGPAALRKAAAEAALRARFPPTRFGGVPVIVKGFLTYKFTQP